MGVTTQQIWFKFQRPYYQTDRAFCIQIEELGDAIICSRQSIDIRLILELEWPCYGVTWMHLQRQLINLLDSTTNNWTGKHWQCLWWTGHPTLGMVYVTSKVLVDWATTVTDGITVLQKLASKVCSDIHTYISNTSSMEFRASHGDWLLWFWGWNFRTGDFSWSPSLTYFVLNQPWYKTEGSSSLRFVYAAFKCASIIIHDVS